MSINPSNNTQETSIYTPKDLYNLRVLGAEFGKNSKGNPMFTLDCEIIGPDSVVLGQAKGGGTVDPRGQRAKFYISITDKSRQYALKNIEVIGVDTNELDLENPDVSLFVDKEFSAIVVCEELTQKNDAGEVILHNGNPIVSYRRNIQQILN